MKLCFLSWHEISTKHCRSSNPLTVTKLNSQSFGGFTQQSQDRGCIRKKGEHNSQCSCEHKLEVLVDLGRRRSFVIDDVSLDYDDNETQLINESHTPLCIDSDGCCCLTVKHPYTIVSFPEEVCFCFQLSEIVATTMVLKNRYWTETDIFFNATILIKSSNKLELWGYENYFVLLTPTLKIFKKDYAYIKPS